MSASVALVTSVAVHVRWPRFSLRDLNRRSADWEVLHPVQWMTLTAVLLGGLDALLYRSTGALVAGAVGGAVFGWLSRRAEIRRRERRAAAGPGPAWYPDPSGRYQFRWWDGYRWTTAVFHDAEQTTDPPS